MDTKQQDNQARSTLATGSALDAAKDAQAEGLRGKYPAACIALAAALKSAQADAEDQARWAKHYADRCESLELLMEKLRQVVTTEHETKAEFVARVRAVLSPNLPK